MRFDSRRRKAIAFAAAMGVAAGLSIALAPSRHSADARPVVPLEQLFPGRVGAWRVEPASAAFVRAPTENGKVYGIYNEVLERAYVNGAGERIMLSVAYGREQSAALQLHRPEVCYTSDGFQVSKLHEEVLDLNPGHLPVTRLHASMLGRSEPITYWALLGDTVVADGSAFWKRRWTSSLRGEILDGMLVRVSSIDADPSAAYRLQTEFVRELSRSMSVLWRDRVFGVAASGASSES